jgi:hypothetical protein
VMARDPAALQLRLLQTVVEVAAEKNSTLVMPVPVELLRFFDRMAPAVAESLAVAPPPADTGDAELAAAEAESEVGGAPEVAAIADAPLPELPEPPADAPLPEIPEAPVPELDESAIPPVDEALAVPPDTDATATSSFTAPPGLDDAPGPTAAPRTKGARGVSPAAPADGQETPNGRRP